jgi:hypothetical protein
MNLTTTNHTPAITTYNSKRKINMPIKKKESSYQWGGHGKVYHGKGAKKKAIKQMKAAYASGYKSKSRRKSC